MKILATLILALAVPVIAQTKPEAPKLTKTETLAIHQIQQEFDKISQLQQQVNTDLADFYVDVSKTHPGYVFDAQSGTLVPAPKPDDKTKSAIPEKK